MSEQNPFVEFLSLYRDNPVLFVREVLGVEPDPWQVELLEAIARGERQISVRSGHGVGKSTASSWAMIWYLLTRFRVKIVVTSQSAPQLWDALWAELNSWIKRLPDALQSLLNVKSESIELLASPSEAFISARTSRAEQPEALAGVHSDYVMLVADEASGIPESVFEAASGSMSSEQAVTILLGNPVRTSGFFFDTHHKLKDFWWTRRVSCLDSSRVSQKYVQEQIRRFGEESNPYRVRVLGDFPRADKDTVIPFELVESAAIRDVSTNPTAVIVWGLDVARFGDDFSCLVKRQANAVTEPPRKWHGLDLMQTAGVVMAEWEATPEDRRPVEILVDAIGLGAGVADRLRELHLPARDINVSESPSLGGTYINLRAELWFKTKSWFEAKNCSIPNDEALREELIIVRYGFQPGSSKLKVESKDDIKRRLKRSCDVADALVLTFASDAGTALYGRSYTSAWSKPIRRRLALV